MKFLDLFEEIKLTPGTIPEFPMDLANPYEYGRKDIPRAWTILPNGKVDTFIDADYVTVPLIIFDVKSDSLEEYAKKLVMTALTTKYYKSKQSHILVSRGPLEYGLIII